MFIVKKDPELSEIAIIKHCQENLTNYILSLFLKFDPWKENNTNYMNMLVEE